MQTKACLNIRKDEANIFLEWFLYIMRQNVEDVEGLALFFFSFLSPKLLWPLPQSTQCFRSANHLPKEASGIANLLPKPMVKRT